jgi:hypothetical protein
MMSLLAAALLSAGSGVIDAGGLPGRWSVGSKPEVYTCENAALYLEMKQTGPQTIEGLYSGPQIDKPFTDTFTLLPEASVLDAERTSKGKVLRFRTPRRTQTLRWMTTAEDAGGKPVQMEWQRRARAGQPFVPLFWMKRCE